MSTLVFLILELVFGGFALAGLLVALSRFAERSQSGMDAWVDAHNDSPEITEHWEEQAPAVWKVEPDGTQIDYTPEELTDND